MIDRCGSESNWNVKRGLAESIPCAGERDLIKKIKWKSENF